MKKNLPGMPCAPRINENFCDYDEVFERCTLCFKGVVGGMANNSCSCCTQLNGVELYWSVFGAGGSGFNPMCGVYHALGVGGAFDDGGFDCSCMGDKFVGGQFFPLFHFLCDSFQFILNASYTTNVGSPSPHGVSIIFGWFNEAGGDVTDADDKDEAVEVVRKLMDGETVRMYIANGGSSGPICNTTGAYIDVSIVTCPAFSPDPPFDPDDCDACDDFTFACLEDEAFDEVNLGVSGLLDCSDESVNPQIYNYFSNLNGNYTLTRRTDPSTVPGCIGFTPWPGFTGATAYWGIEIGIPNTSGTPAPYDELGERWFAANYDYQLVPFYPVFPNGPYRHTLEEIVWSVGVVAGCEDRLFRFGYIEFATQIFVVIRDLADAIVYLGFIGTSCHRFTQDDAEQRQDECVSIDRCDVLGSGAVSALMEYDLCGSTEIFGATLVMSEVDEG